MAVNFPSNPTNGQTVTFGSTTYTYNSTKGIWSSGQASIDNYLQVANSTSLQTKADAVVSNNAILSLITDRLQVANLQPQLDKYLQVANSTSFASTSQLDAYLQVANLQPQLDKYLQVGNAVSLTAFDVLTSTPSGNGSLVYNSSNGSFTFTPADATQGGVGGGGSGNTNLTVSDSAPGSPSDGDLWFDSEDLIMYVYYNDGSSSQWVKTSPSSSTDLSGYLQVANSTGFASTTDLDAYLQVANANFVNQSTLDAYLQVANSTSFATTTQLDAYLQVANSTSFASTSELDAYLQVANANFITQSTLDGYLQVANSTSFATTGSLDAYLQVANSTSFASTSSLDAYLQVANSTGFASSTDLDAYLQVANAISLTSFNVLTSTPSGNGSLVYNSSNGSFTFTPADATQGGGGGGGGASVTASDTAPASPSAGDLWFHTTQLKLYVYYSDGSSNQWVQTNSGVGNRVDEFIKAYRYQGTLAINTGDTRLYLQDSYILKGIHAYVDTAPVGSSVITDVKKNGSSLQTITVAAGATTASNTSLSHTFVSGDYLTVDITQVGSSTAGENLYMVFTFN